MKIITGVAGEHRYAAALALRDGPRVRSNSRMQVRGAAVLVGSLLIATAADAAGPHAAPFSADALTAMPAASAGKPLRTQRDLRWSAP
ncbi:MAG TPA: hypothetical protein VIX73_20825, partial [Kofleriaceae bacterium]